MHHFPPFQPNPKGTSAPSIRVCAPDTPPPSPPHQIPSPPSPSSPSGWRAAAALDPPRPRRQETPAEADPCCALPVLRAPRRRDGAIVPTLAEIEDEMRSHGRMVFERPRPRPQPAKRPRCPAPVDAVVSRPPSPPPSSAGVPATTTPRPLARCGARPQGEPTPRLRPALRTPSSDSSSSSAGSSAPALPPSKPRKNVRFAAAAPATHFFAPWDAPSSLKLLRRTPERAVPELAGGGGGGGGDVQSRGRGHLPLSPPPAWHWKLRTPDLPAAAAAARSARGPPPPVVQLRDLFRGARRPWVVLGLVSVARRSTPPGAVMCEGSRDGGRTWAAARADAGWFCAAPRCDWFQFALDAASLGLFGDDAGLGGEKEEEEGASASDRHHHHNSLALRVRCQDEDGRQWVDDNHGTGFIVRFELCWAGGAADGLVDEDEDDDDKDDDNDDDNDNDDDDWGTTPGELGWDE